VLVCVYPLLSRGGASPRGGGVALSNMLSGLRATPLNVLERKDARDG